MTDSIEATVQIKVLTDIDDIREMQDLEKEVWGMSPIPIHQTLTAAKNGGILLGAYAEGKMVGFSYGFPGYRDGFVYLCSHMTGFHQDFRKKGLGRILKIKQAEIARSLGYSMITWTFDPMETVNGYLNLSKLHSIGAAYHVNLYGDMNDSLNSGLPSDRFQVEWWINSRHVKENNGWEELIGCEINKERILLGAGVNRAGLPQLDDPPFDYKKRIQQGSYWLVPVPTEFQSIKKTDMILAVDWRLKTRLLFKGLLEEGYVAVHLCKNAGGQIHYYLFVPKTKLALQEE